MEQKLIKTQQDKQKQIKEARSISIPVGGLIHRMKIKQHV